MPGHAATRSQLEERKHRQEATLHRDRGTVRFFANHPWLLKHGPAHQRLIAAQALSFARARIRWVARELAETRAALHPPPVVRHLSALLCIHGGEGAWDANTGNGYYGGLQMDWSFMRSYGPELLVAKGTADRWTPLEQMMVAERAVRSRGFSPWPSTARVCGLI